MARCRTGSSSVFAAHSGNGAKWGCSGEGVADLVCLLQRASKSGTMFLRSFDDGDHSRRSLGRSTTSRVGENMGVVAGVEAVALAWLCAPVFH